MASVQFPGIASPSVTAACTIPLPATGSGLQPGTLGACISGPRHMRGGRVPVRKMFVRTVPTSSLRPAQTHGGVMCDEPLVTPIGEGLARRPGGARAVGARAVGARAVGARAVGGRHRKGRPRPFGQPVGSPRTEARQRRPSRDRARRTAACALIRQFAARSFLSVFRIGRARHRKAVVDLRLLIPEIRFLEILDSSYLRVPGGAVPGLSPQRRGWRRGEFPEFPQ
jgi:hypothetical protein